MTTIFGGSFLYELGDATAPAAPEPSAVPEPGAALLACGAVVAIARRARAAYSS